MHFGITARGQTSTPDGPSLHRVAANFRVKPRCDNDLGSRSNVAGPPNCGLVRFVPRLLRMNQNTSPFRTVDRRRFGSRALAHQLVIAPVLGLVFLAIASRDDRLAPIRDQDSITRTSLTVGGDRGPIAIRPTGWRRTPRGWEHVSQWRPRPSRTMRETLRRYEQRPADRWVAPVQRTVGQAPVWTWAVAQLTVVGAVVGATTRRNPS